MVELGGNIELVGFHDLDAADMIILKKIIGSYVRKFSDHCQDYKKLSLTLKKVHGTKYEVTGQLELSKVYAASCTEVNLFVCIDNVLKKMEKQALK